MNYSHEHIKKNSLSVSKIKNLLPAIFVLCLFSAQFVSAQINSINVAKLQIHASVNESIERTFKLKKADVTLYQDAERTGNWTGIEKTKTNARGEFSFKLDYNSKFMVEISKEGFVSKRITFDTNVFGATITSQDFYFMAQLEDGENTATSEIPVANVFYVVEKNKFDYELNYAKAEAGK